MNDTSEENDAIARVNDTSEESNAIARVNDTSEENDAIAIIQARKAIASRAGVWSQPTLEKPWEYRRRYK